MREPHLVPLSTQAVVLLNELHTLTGGQRWLFPNMRRPRTCMTMTTLNRALERMGYGGRFSAHGFRATASTFLNEMGWRSDVIERQLAHQERNSTRRSYNQAEYLLERRSMMQAWEFGAGHVRLSTPQARIACAMPCSAISNANSSITLLSR